MIIKKFVAKTELEATESAKKELGPNVVVMNVKNVKRKGFFSFLKPQLVEVTVALEEESERISAQKREEQNVKEAISSITQVISEKDVANKTMVSNDSAKRSDSKTPMKEAVQRGDSSRTESSAIEEKLDSLQNLLEQQIIKTDSDKGNEDDKVKTSEIEKKEELDAEMVRFMKLLYNQMIDNEVNEKYANQIIEEMEKTTKPGMPFDYALANTYQKMILKFGAAESITPAKQGPKVVFFIGPTGVGKTTTIAKIASLFSVNEKKKVALLTADTYRIAAAEQLRTYANILEVPFRVIYTVEEVEQALVDFKAYDYIFVDTAGHSHQNETQREHMNSFIHSVDGLAEKEVFLVLSATTKYRDLISISDTYSSMTNYKLIFTKLDETLTLGNLLNLRLHTNAAISYVTNGQNVPDDIAIFNPQKTVKQLLGGKK